MEPSRQLAAIMFTDIVGYTSLMGSDETKAMKLVRRNREIQKTLVEKHRGKWLKEMGDGAMASFPTASDAVLCAINIQEEIYEEEDLKIRIGIHLGEIMIESDDIYGDGVNIASRIEAIGIPGSILISGNVWDEIQNKDISTSYIGEVHLKNDQKKRKIYAINGNKLSIPKYSEIRKSGSKATIPVVYGKRPLIIAIIAILLLICSGFIWYRFKENQRIKWANTVAVPAIEKYTDEYVFPGKSEESWNTYDLARKASEIIPENQIVSEFLDTRTSKKFVQSRPSGAEIYYRPYKGDTTWRLYGRTPLEVNLPNGISQVQIKFAGFETYQDLIWTGISWLDGDSIIYDLTNEPEKGMVYIPESAQYYRLKGAPASLRLVGLEEAPYVDLGAFYMDKFEVTNLEFKDFVDASGYSNPEYWDYPVVHDGRTLSFSEAKDLFVDKTGLSGPATWEGGSFAKGMEYHPVSGVSWYEAAAYAKFVNKSLPSAYHWDRAALTWGSSEIAQASNINKNASKPVGVAINRFGTYDLGGNIREWCFNETRQKQKVILGGGWSDLPYAFNDFYAQPPLDRSEINGFRCIKTISAQPDDSIVFGQIDSPFRDFKNEPIVSDEVFETYLSQYKYDKTDLQVTTIESTETDQWNKEIVEFNAAYGNERMRAFLFTPKNTKPPYQTLVYFPGSGAIHNNSSEDLSPSEYILNSGRAIMYPILKSTYERRDDLISDYPNQTVHWKNHVIMWVKDFSRTIDYLETRDDIDTAKIGYFGYSWGGAMGSIVPAVEKRLKLNILIVAGLNLQKSLPEVDEPQYLPRVTTPTIMVNGKYDFFFPHESSQKPFYDLLGTPEDDKVLKLYEGSHSVPRVQMIRDVLGWMDKYWGAAK